MEIDLQNNVVDKTMTNEEQDKQVQQSQNYITFKDLEQVSFTIYWCTKSKTFSISIKSSTRWSITFCMNGPVVSRP